MQLFDERRSVIGFFFSRDVLLTYLCTHLRNRDTGRGSGGRGKSGTTCDVSTAAVLVIVLIPQLGAGRLRPISLNTRKNRSSKAIATGINILQLLYSLNATYTLTLRQADRQTGRLLTR